MTFTLTSSAFENNANIPDVHTCSGADVSPPLQWEDVPTGAQSFALIMDDPDAPAGTWVHWVMYDIPANLKGLPHGIVKKASLEDGTKQGAVWGVESFSRVGYHGPCPPPGKPHHYIFKLYALDVMLGLNEKATKFQVEEAMVGHVLAEARWVGVYGR